MSDHGSLFLGSDREWSNSRKMWTCPSLPTALNFDDLGIEIDNINDDKTFEPEKKEEPKPKRKKIRLEETILAGERLGLDDFKIAMMYNAGSK